MCTQPKGRFLLVIAGVAAAIVLASSACGEEEQAGAPTPTPSPPATATPMPALGHTLRLQLSGLEPLSQGHYEGWAVFGEEKVSTGKFNLASDGSLVSLDGSPISAFEVDRDLRGADMIVVTIEPDGDVDTVPSGIVVLAGPVVDGQAALSFPTDLSSLVGSYVLATPTDDDDTNEAAGVWFLDPSGPSPSLTLPALPDNWVYEGWAVTQGIPLSTGRFSSARGADSAAPFSGPTAGPPFPGEDFLVNLLAGITAPVNLADGSSKIVISIEPDMAGDDPTGPAPFAIKPLVAAVPENLGDHLLTVLDQMLATLTSGTATIS